MGRAVDRVAVEGADVTQSDPNTDVDALRERILRRASELFARAGYHQTSTSEIAAAVDISISVLAHHFASKVEIMNTILKHDLGAAVAAAERQLTRTGSPATRLYEYLVEDVGTACQSPYSVGINATSGLLRELDFAGARARSQRLSDARVAIIEEGIEAGEFVEVDPQSASRAIEWTIEGALTEPGPEREHDPEAFAHEVAGFCLRALVADTSTFDRIRSESGASLDEDCSS
ncbi:MAG: TetR/AcrR family transcriptional regulator [Gemmatimonadetes bacterium]|nr:TetR/AcrR family transcriptional regulator [Gemmatimonadota bacterium]